jgi:hypothetical protein
MNWICPNCKKEFRNKNQWHSCFTVDIDYHLRNKSPEVITIFNKLMEKIEKFGKINFNSVKSSIQIKAGATFLSLKFKKNYIELEFQLGYEIDEFPIYRSVRISGNRLLHFAILESPDEVNKKLLKWLNDSYKLVKKN